MLLGQQFLSKWQFLLPEPSIDAQEGKRPAGPREEQRWDGLGTFFKVVLVNKSGSPWVDGVNRALGKKPFPVSCLTLVSAQVLHLLGPKTETDLEKKPKVGLSMVLGPWG